MSLRLCGLMHFVECSHTKLNTIVVCFIDVGLLICNGGLAVNQLDFRVLKLGEQNIAHHLAAMATILHTHQVDRVMDRTNCQCQ
jgi:hypothetical protein